MIQEESTLKLIAEWFLTDRWMGSSGFLLPMEARGVYREMLTQAWRRGGKLPNNHEAIKRAIGATDSEWARCWPEISQYWRTQDGCLVNDTQVAIYNEALAKAEAASKKGVKGAQASAQARAQARAQAEPEQEPEHQPPSPSPSPSPYLSLVPKETETTTTTTSDGFPTATFISRLGPEDVADRYVACFNAVLDRGVSCNPDILERVRAHLKNKYRPWQIIALPIICDAQGLGDIRKDVELDWFLRDGKHQRTKNGQTYGATNWVARAHGKLDKTSLSPRLTAIAKACGVLEQLKICRVQVSEQVAETA